MSEVVTLEVANRWESYAEKALAGEPLTRGEARTVLVSDDDQLLQLLHAAYRGNMPTTHAYDDRVATLESVKRAGISPCSGFIAGMGESDEQIVDVAFALREIDADSIPINFLHAVDGTPLEGTRELNARRCLKILALLRFVCPSKEIRVAGGRELNLGSLQPLALFAANSIFIGDYLTTPGQSAAADYRMIEDLGFEIEECAL